MIPRPKRTDTMEDVLAMQEDFRQKKDDEKFAPAAQAIKKSPAPKQSVFARSRNIKQPAATDNVSEDPVIGEVVERNNDVVMMEVDVPSGESQESFPKPQLVDSQLTAPRKSKSIFSQMTTKATKSEDPSSILSDIHSDNLRILGEMSEAEILEEQAKLLKSMDPKLVDFVKSKRKAKDDPVTTKPKVAAKIPSQLDVGTLPAIDFLKEKEAANWLHFDVLEPEKLEWTKNVEQKLKALKPGQTFEARFDWKGFMQPYLPEQSDEDKDDRELFLHGEEPQRPGYTLAELLRLSRANVIQQRISAINAIAGIINMYNQGFYDGIIELPITRIFFFLRMALDENAPAILEVTSRALGFLFYNETDETLLDLIVETRHGFVQPVLDNRKASVAGSGQEEAENDIETTLKNLKLQEELKLNDDKLEDLLDYEQEARDTYSDYHLAEVNLVECLIRTNILERLSYILLLSNPTDITISSCTKILIRLARSSRENAEMILNKRNLVEGLVSKYLRCSKPHYLVLKLFRMISSYDIAFCQRIVNLKVVDIAKEYVTHRKETEVSPLKFQIECFRFLRLNSLLFLDTGFNELIAPISYFLGWHFDNMDFKLDNHFIIRTHASALMYLISSADVIVTYPSLSEKFKLCASKWFANALRLGAPDISQKLLLATLLDVATKFVHFASDFFFDFVDNYLLKFLVSPTFKKITRDLCYTSPLFKSCEDRCNAHRPLINVGAIVRHYKSPVPTLVLTSEYPIHLMDALLIFIEAFDSQSNARNSDYHRNLCGVFYTEDVEKYLESFASHFNHSLSANWFVKTEFSFIANLLDARSMQFNSSLLKVAFNLLNCLTKENGKRVLDIFRRIVFNDRFYYEYQVNEKELKRWQSIYNGLVISKFKENEQKQRNVAVAEFWNQIVLNDGWPYSLLMILLYRSEIDAENKRIVETELTEEEIITTALKFTLLLEKNKITTVSMNQQLMYLMVAYFGNDVNFLNPTVKQLIKEKLSAMRNYSFPPRFNLKLNKEKSFEGIYTMLLDTFQSSGYCDEVFSVLVMIPLAQKYDVKWRKLVWSVYQVAMKFISCREEDLLGGIEAYLTPVETDETLLKSYKHAIATKNLRPDSVPMRIAEHHLRNANMI